tara:strand:- start:166 stop:846 length:681 start_codon:yes stop_codon:yes gene_type:complete
VTKVGGYFIGTSYDGEAIFRLLYDKEKGESDVIMMEGDKIWEVTKQYERKDFSDNSTSLGYAIDVFQETINKKFREYLVNYKYLTRMLQNYGFTLVSDDEAKQMGIPSGTGMFSELFDSMKTEIKRNKRHNYGVAPQMNQEQRKISFLNRYFIYKKTHNVNADTVSKNLLAQTLEDEMDAMAKPPVTEVIDEETPAQEKTEAKPKKVNRLKLKSANKKEKSKKEKK